MATIKYNGVEIQSITECKAFEEPREMLVWNKNFPCPIERMVCAIIPYRHAGSVITTSGAYEYCAEIPKKPEPRRATWMEVAKWCATGKGLVYDTNRDKIDTGVMFTPDNEHEPIMDELKVRKWDDTEWHDPDVEYMGITEVKTYEDVVKREG